MPLMGFIGNFGYVAVCVVGAALTMNGRISFGVIVAFTMYVRLFTQPLNQIAQAANNLQRTGAASERVFEFFEEEELEDESYKTKTLKSIKGDVEFKHVKSGGNGSADGWPDIFCNCPQAFDYKKCRYNSCNEGR